MTLGVAGTGFPERDMVKGGSEGIRIAPARLRLTAANLKSKLVEWRCLSFREARISYNLTEGNRVGEVTGPTQAAEAAEQDCAALSYGLMLNICAPSLGHTG
jgi:hypothetical protein